VLPFSVTSPVTSNTAQITLGTPRQFELTIEDWLQRAQLQEVRAAIAKDEYSAIYPHLLAHFRSMPRPLAESDLIAALHIVYGWMPTIARPGLSLRVIAESRAKLLQTMEAARIAREPALTTAEVDLLKRFANNSTVGASKLLHFFNPAVYAIWDSRVARRFMWNSVVEDTYDKAYRLLEYTNTLWGWTRDRRVRRAVADLRKLNGHLEPVTEMRLLELVLFHPVPETRGPRPTR